ncbi:tetratricopeptide repeat protein [Microcystis aeruginosa]|uniref:Similar to tr/Q8YUC9/Q8YUC9 n=1 Tax=Microcystis aeruginosa PCC 9808 TaxID=1160284 RepID=I4HWB7_MICAE|nr:tetratricopeptide repeat protein [Microcystis aeruginosa]CCI26341.1 Similar to tr/Q8YUC9/Q8YUC9 [Microcystis aeruginosa PCC 9808]
MPKKSYGETVEKRVKRLFEVLLDHVAHCQCEDNDWGVKLALGEEGKLLRVETNLAALVRLAEQKGEKLTKDQVRDAISHYLADYLGILRDERFKQQGSEEWRFSLTLWAKCGDKTTNLTKFSEEWHKRRSEPSKKAVTKPEATAQSSPQPLTTSGLVDTQLPPVRRWQGRREELQELQTALGNDHLRLIEITAAGGYGKTALARKFTDQLTADWPVLWVNFNQPYPLAQFGRWLLEELKQNYDEKWNDGQLIDAISKGLTAKPCLLVLNNLETVLTAPVNLVYQQFLQKWLNTESSSKLLVTSREQLKFPVNLQDYYYSWPLKGLKEADAMRYVTEDHGLTGSDEELAQFVDKMGGHPLLMELVCSLMKDKFGKGVSVTESQNLGLNLFEVEGYHRDTETCVREVITASLARLSKEFRESLTRLSVLRESFDLGLAQALTPEITEEDLRYFARLSLLQEFPPEYNVKRRQFQFLPLISMVVQDQANPEILRSAHQLALNYYLAHLPVPPWESLEDLKEYLEAFHHAGALGEWQLAYDILDEDRGGEGKNKSVDSFLDLQGFYRKRAELYEEIIAGSQREQVCYRNSLNRLGNCYYYLGDCKKAICYYQQQHDIAQAIDDQQAVASSLGNLGSCYYYLGDYQKAIKHHQQHHDIAQAIGDLQGVAKSLGNRGLCYYSQGDYKKAITYHQKYHDIAKDIGDQRGMAISLGNWGNCYYSLGEYDKAIAFHQKSLKIKEGIGDQRGMAKSLGSLGIFYYSQRDYKQAINYHQKSLKIKEGIGDQRGMAKSLGSLGICYASLGDYEKAIAHHQQDFDIGQTISDRSGIAHSLHNIGEALLKLENYSEAERKIQASLVISQDIGYKYLIAYSLRVLAEIDHQTNRPELALSHCQEALELCQELGITLVKDCEELLGQIQVTLEGD